MSPDFLSALLERSWNGELNPGQFQDELGAHVTALAGQIQDINARRDAVLAGIEVDRNLAVRGETFRAQAIIDTFCELAVRPLRTERDLCTGRLIIDKAFKVNPIDPQLAAALFALGLK